MTLDNFFIVNPPLAVVLEDSTVLHDGQKPRMIF
jgi:hypothetical protein